MPGLWDAPESISHDARNLFQQVLAAGGTLDGHDRADLVEELLDLGLARTDHSGLHVLPPREALAARASDLAGRRDRLLELADELAGVWEQYVDSPSVEVLVGEAAGDAFQQMIAGASRHVEACSINAAPTGAELGQAAAQEPAQDRGVEFRVLYDVAVMGDPVGVAAVRQAVAMGEIARVLPKVPMTYLAADGEVMGVYPPFDRWDTRQMLRTRHQGLVRVMSEFFELLWDLAIEVRPTAWEQPAREVGTDVEGGDQILLLMAAGLSDHAIARELGMSERTLSRRISDLQVRLGAKTRYQLGYQAALRLREPPG